MVEQNINIVRFLEFLALIMTMIISAIVIASQIKKGYKNYIDNKLKIVDMKTNTIEKSVEEYERYNEREHDKLNETHKESLKEMKEYFDARFGELRQDIRDSKKSA